MSSTRLPSIPGRGLYTESARRERLEWIRELSGRPLHAIQQMNLSPERVEGNIENLIGSVELPVGVAGPLLFEGEYARGMRFAPFATVEGTLVTAACRGARAISKSGGITTRVLSQRMTRAPYFRFEDLDSALRFQQIVEANMDALQGCCSEVSSHARLVRLEPAVIGNMVHIRFVFETGDAAGQNMTTACTWHACKWLVKRIEQEKSLKLVRFTIDGNFSGDKKVNWHSFLDGRGTRVAAECLIKGDVLRHVLKVSVDDMIDGWSVGVSSAMQTGMIGFNVNLANAVAAIFAATGQDMASVHESAIGQLYCERQGEDLYVSLLLPSLVVGTIGGGTGLPQQQEYLSMMGCDGPGGVQLLCEIIAGFCVALDLSTMAALMNGQFAGAHERLGRNRPVAHLSLEELGIPVVQAALGDHGPRVTDVKELDFDPGSSVISEFTARRIRRPLGHFARRMIFEDGSSEEVILKVKPTAKEVILTANTVAGMCGTTLAQAHNRFKHLTGFAGCDERELAVYEQVDPRFVAHTPRIHGVLRDPGREAFVIVMEMLRPEKMHLMDSEAHRAAWGHLEIESTIDGLAALHSIWLDRESELQATTWLGSSPSARSMTEMSDLWLALAEHSFAENPEWLTDSDRSLQQQLIRSIPDWWAEIEEMPRTLIHGDFNPRNVALRHDETGGLRVCAYDWELATLHLPQRDLAELLCFVLDEEVDRATIDQFVERHRERLSIESGIELDAHRFRRGFQLSLQDLLINRFAYYQIAHSFREYPFLEPCIRTLMHLLKMEVDG